MLLSITDIFRQHSESTSTARIGECWSSRSNSAITARNPGRVRRWSWYGDGDVGRHGYRGVWTCPWRVSLSLISCCTYLRSWYCHSFWQLFFAILYCIIFRLTPTYFFQNSFDSKNSWAQARLREWLRHTRMGPKNSSLLNKYAITKLLYQNNFLF